MLQFEVSICWGEFQFKYESINLQSINIPIPYKMTCIHLSKVISLKHSMYNQYFNYDLHIFYPTFNNQVHYVAFFFFVGNLGGLGKLYIFGKGII